MSAWLMLESRNLGQSLNNGHGEGTPIAPCPALACRGKTILEESLPKGKMRAPWTILGLSVC